MATVGRITVTALLILAGAIAQSVGCWLIRMHHEPFDLAEFGGLIVIGLSWLIAFQVTKVWPSLRSPA
jgi:hypothetical protein